MQVVDFWIPYNFLSLLLFTVGTQHLTKKKKKRKTKSVKLFKCLNKDMVFWLCLSKFEKILPAFKLYFSFLSITVSLSLSLCSKQAHGKMKMYRWAVHFQSGCCVNMASGKEAPESVWETQMYTRHPNHHVWAASASLKYASSSPGTAVWGRREMELTDNKVLVYRVPFNLAQRDKINMD